jgi:RNA polymerase sigma-70 factor (ECF subfamily)
VIVDYPSLSDRKLVEAICLSDKEAFKTLYYRYYQKLYRFLWYRTGSIEQAKDTLQEVFIRLWQRRENLDADKSIKSYLYSIAYNLVIDHLKKDAKQRLYRTNIIENSSSSFDTRINLEIDIQKAIDQLPEPIKIVFCLSRNEGLKYTEIAEIFGISVKTVEYRISRALTLLDKKLS